MQKKIILKKIISAIPILFLFLFLFYGSSTLKNINDEQIPTGYGYGIKNATFYLYPENSVFPFISMKSVGNGTLLNPVYISNNPQKVSSLIVIPPNLEGILTSNQFVEWESIIPVGRTFSVIGVIKNTDDIETSQIEDVKKFNNVNELLTSNLSDGDIVSTLGYYMPNDGGAANYTIHIMAPSSLAEEACSLQLKNGLYATLSPQDNTIIVEQLGAIGDGISDDVIALQKAFDCGYEVSFSEEKNYLISSNGLFLRNNLNIQGNNATILINDTFSPTNTDSFKKHIFYSDLQPYDFLSISNLNIDVDMTESKYIDDYLCVFMPTYANEVTLDRLNITVAESYNRITTFWMNHGCESIKLSNCNFYNYSTYQDGGILFLQSCTDKIFNTYNDFKNVYLYNCNFIGTNGDEAIAIWGDNSQNILFEDCYINWQKPDGGYSRAIAIYNENNTSSVTNVTFKNSTFNCTCLDPNNNTLDSFIGVGSAFSNNQFNISFSDCTITADISGSLIYPSIFNANTTEINDFDLNFPSVNITFSDTNINCNAPITGNSPSFSNTKRNILAWNCSFDNCNIQCQYSFAYLQCYSSTNNYFIPSISLSNCNVTIDNDKGFIYQTTLSAECDLSISSTDIIAPNTNDLFTTQYFKTFTNINTQSNSNLATRTIKDVTINSYPSN